VQAVAIPRLRPAPFPEHAGLRAGELAALAEDVDALPGAWCAGAVVLAGRGRWTALEHAAGSAVRYASWDPEGGRGVELPAADQVPMRADTVFDLASLTKLFTAIAVLQQAERGTLTLDDEIIRHAPDPPVPDHGITVRHLLTHTSGLRPELPLYDLPPRQRPGAPWAEEPLTEPGTRYAYSDLNLLLAQQVLTTVTGRPLDVLVQHGITAPLGMRHTRFRPPPQWRAHIAATEDQRRPWAKAERGMLQGSVHDENAHALGGVAGHAGLFSTAGDLAVLCRTLLSGGVYGTARILSAESVARLLSPPGLGFAVDQPRFMGELAGPASAGRAAGHTGLVLDPATDSFLILLANTVHPVRRPPDSRPRARAATRLARALL
jgi:CubicO group peptidase (beta-lactamase class C family)